jgi:hypothetical protein
MRLVGFAALFAAGLLVAGVAAGVGGAQTADTTTTTVTQPTTETSTVEETTTVEQTTTTPATTVLTTTTVEPATTVGTTTASSESSAPAWAWVLLAVLGAAVIALVILLVARRNPALPEGERRLRLQGAINSWAAQGWALVSETTDTAVLQRGAEHMMVTVDPTGQVITRPATAQAPAAPPPYQPPAEQPTRELPPDDRWPGSGA